MKSRYRPWAIGGVLLLAVIVLAVGTWLIARAFFWPLDGWRGGMMDQDRFGERRYDERSFSSNGEQIYFTATSRSGPPISEDMHGGGMPMMGGRLACADCHGENGQGGTVRMMMSVYKAPNIQFDHLAEEQHEEGEEDHPPYTEETLKQAITQGINPAGEPLEWPMPVWNMTDEQLNDLVEYLKTLD